MRILRGAQVLVIQEVAEFRSGRCANPFEIERHLDRGPAAIEESHGLAAVGERPGPDFQGALLPNPASLYPVTVLIHGDDVGVGK